MNETNMNFKLPALLFFIIFITGRAFALESPDDEGCRLNFTAFPYQAIGGCNYSINEKLKDWHDLPQTSCCRNALNVFSHALALEALNDPMHNIFIAENQWKNCSGPFKLQPQVSAHYCGFDNFFYGNEKCSTLQLRSINQTVIDQCSHFSPSFDVACGNCTSAISNEVNNYLIKAKNATEKAICFAAVIISVMAANIKHDTSALGDFIRCLPALEIPESESFIIIKYGVAEAISAVILLMVGLTAIILLIKYVTRDRNHVKKHVYKNIASSFCSIRFSKTEIENAMNYQAEKKFLGRGSAGMVYKGMLPSGQLVAIKQIYKNNTSDSFTREIEGLSRVRHKNLVCLFGCCIEDGEQYLVYEYCPNGNLAQQLLRKDTALTWVTRVKILRNCALALKYLHSHQDGCIVHRDIKLTNILLTNDMDPKLSDFGLARLLGIEESKVFTDVRGTIGYMDPEYMSNAKLTCASDIYSFGIVILQLLSGQRVIELDLQARDQLTRKAKDVNSQKRPLTDFQDPRMKEDVISVGFESILQIAVLCVASSSTGRPTIDQVVDELEKAWKNTEEAEKKQKAMKERNLLMGTLSKSPELLCM